MLNQKTRTLALIALTSVLSFTASAQISTYKYKRELKGITEKWQSLALPSQFFGKVQGDLSDLRIYGIKGKDTIEVPFFVKDNSLKKTEQKADAKLINKAAADGVHFITIVPETTNTINKIDLTVVEDNFDWLVKLEGSNDNSSWFTLLTNYRITGIKNQSIAYKFSTLNFEEAQYKYYRISIPNKEQPKIEGATTSKQDSLLQQSKSTVVTSFNLKNDQKSKTTIIDVQLKNVVPISKVSLKVMSDMDYYRPIKIECVTDSFETSKKQNYNYMLLHDGFLTSVEKPTFQFDGPFTDKIKITIENFDNQPLAIKGITVDEAQYNLVARFGAADYNYALYYGNDKANAPVYDLENFKNKVPINLASVTVENEKQNPDLLIKKDSSLVQNKYWLWGLIAIAVAALGYFALRMLKE